MTRWTTPWFVFHVVALALASVSTRGADARAPETLKGVDVAGKLHFPGRGAKGAVLVFLHPECPIATQYLPELARLAADAKEKGIDWHGVVTDPKLTRKQVAQFVAEYAIPFPVLFDHAGELRQRFNPQRVPEAVVVGADGKVLYQGRVDDTWAGIGKRRAVSTRRDLALAIAAIAEGRKPDVDRVEPVGCPIEPVSAADSKVTYNRHVAPIIQTQCQSCHRPGEVAPFSLTNFGEVVSKASAIGEVTAGRIMPPWKAAPGHGVFKGERRLTDHEIATIQKWIADGLTEGNPADLPPAPTFVDGWQLGEPDLVLKMPASFTVPADGADVYQHFVIPLPLSEDKEVVAFEFRPGNRRIVHHAILYVDSSGTARRLDEASPELGYRRFGSPGFRPSNVIGFWAPGYSPDFMPKGVARPLRVQNADLVMQIHYHPSGKTESDQSAVGIYFAKEKPTRQTADFVIGSLKVDIAPGEKTHRISTQVGIPVDIEVVGYTPHMHLIGKTMKLTATLPDGRKMGLIDVNAWDFDWQEQYRCAAPLLLPKGTTIDLEATYDNTSDNPANPSSPPKRMMLGEQSTDEMCLCVVHTVVDRGDDSQRLLRQAAQRSIMKTLDAAVIKNLNPEFKEEIFRTLTGGREAKPNPGR